MSVRKTKSAKVVKETKQPEKSQNMLELSDENFKKIKVIADHFRCTCEEALNNCLNSFEFEIYKNAKEC